MRNKQKRSLSWDLAECTGTPVLHMGQPATSQISDTRVPHCPSIKWQLREWSEETLQPFCRAFAGEEEGSEMGVWLLKRMA